MTDSWLFDLDGVVWLADEKVPGAADAIGRLAASGRRVAYFTNNSNPRRADHLAKLHRFGLDATDGDLITSAESAAALCRAGERALVLGGPGIREALALRGVEAVDAGDGGAPSGFDAVLVGLDPQFDYARLSAAHAAVRAGARLIGTNDDPVFPSPRGLLPGGGSLLAAVAYAARTEPEIAGKPRPAAVALVRRRLGEVHVVVGDSAATDGALARGLGARFALVLSGVTPAGHGPLDPAPDVEASDVADLVARLETGDLDEGLGTSRRAR